MIRCLPFEKDKPIKKILLIAIFLFTLLLTPSATFAQGMMGNWTSSPSSVTSDDHTAREEIEGKEIWDKLQTKQLECKNLTDENYGSLGEYYMGQMMGNSHAAMNTMMERMMGKEGEEQMHIVMGKRLSGCDTSAQLPQNGVGFIPMMWMMGGGGNPMMGSLGINPMGSFGWGFGLTFMILFWGLVILAIVALVKWVASKGKSQTQEKSALDILKERYAKGEIDKKEFEEIKKDLR